MYHRSPTSLSFCIIMTVVTYLLLDWQDDRGFRGEFLLFSGGRWQGVRAEGGGEGAGGRWKTDRQVRKGGDTQVA